MPKTLVLYHGSSDASSALADVVADGVRSVRFAEVDVRRLPTAGETASVESHRTLTGAAELAAYDGLVLGATAGRAIPQDVAQLLADASELRQQKALTSTVGSAFATGGSADENEDARWMLLRALGALGLVLVPGSGEGAEPARQLGHRVAHVVSWITHARSHQH